MLIPIDVTIYQITKLNNMYNWYQEKIAQLP